MTGRFLDESVEVQAIPLHSQNDNYHLDGLLTDSKWREKVFKVVPRMKFDCVVELHSHLGQLALVNKGTKEDLE